MLGYSRWVSPKRRARILLRGINEQGKAERGNELFIKNY